MIEHSTDIPDDILKTAEDLAQQMPALMDGCDCPGCIESVAFIIAEALVAERESCAGKIKGGA